ncbi:MAG: nucleotidyltransferase domain-containing protein [Anaerolineales bacterium]
MKPLFPDLSLLSNVFEKYPEIQAVYLFGSMASKTENAQSDIDLAIVPQNSSLAQKKLDILADVTAKGFNKIDLVFLDTNDIVLRFEAIRQNKVIYYKKDFDYASYYSLTIRQYFDFVPFLNMQREAYKKRILSHGD